VDPESTQNNSPEVRHIPFATTAVDLARAHPCRCPVGPQTMLTVLTQGPPFLSGNWAIEAPCPFVPWRKTVWLCNKDTETVAGGANASHVR